QYRNKTYSLTDAGKELAHLAADRETRGALYDRLVLYLIDRHPHFRALLRALNAAPLLLPEITEEDVKDSKAKGRGALFWADHVVSLIGADSNDQTGIEKIVRDFLNNRFRGANPRAVTNKDKAKALNEAMAAGSLHWHRLPFGPTDLRMMAGWGMSLLLL